MRTNADASVSSAMIYVVQATCRFDTWLVCWRATALEARSVMETCSNQAFELRRLATEKDAFDRSALMRTYRQQMLDRNYRNGTRYSIEVVSDDPSEAPVSTYQPGREYEQLKLCIDRVDMAMRDVAELTGDTQAMADLELAPRTAEMVRTCERGFTDRSRMWAQIRRYVRVGPVDYYEEQTRISVYGDAIPSRLTADAERRERAARIMRDVLAPPKPKDPP